MWGNSFIALSALFVLPNGVAFVSFGVVFGNQPLPFPSTSNSVSEITRQYGQTRGNAAQAVGGGHLSRLVAMSNMLKCGLTANDGPRGDGCCEC